MLFLCSVLRLVFLWYLQKSHMDHGPTLGKSHVLWGNPYAPGDVELILVGDRGLPAAGDTLFYDIQYLCSSVHTINEVGYVVRPTLEKV